MYTTLGKFIVDGEPRVGAGTAHMAWVYVDSIIDHSELMQIMNTNVQEYITYLTCSVSIVDINR